MVRFVVAVAVLVAGACQGKDSAPAGTGAGSAPPSDDARPPELHEEAPVPDDGRARPEEPEVPVDPSVRLHELGAISAWEAVIDRAHLLARRGQRGVVYGRIGPALAPYAWLVDDTEGHGSLGIRVRLDGGAKEGDRVALGGAWELDAQRTWFWRVDAVEPLPPASPTTIPEPPAPAPVPSHVVATGPAPEGTRPISLAKDGDLVQFQVVGPAPVTDGDGWLIADQRSQPPVALINLPGERPSYGGHDMRTPDERWQLKRGETYWLRIGKVRRRVADKPFLVNARTAPVRVP